MVQFLLKTLKETKGANDKIKRFHLILDVNGRLEVLKNSFFYFISGCHHNQISQRWTQPQMGLLWSFLFFHKKEFLKDFLQHVLKNIYNSPNNLHDLC